MYTVGPHYLELGYFELPAISNSNSFPLVLSLCFQSFTIGYLELRYLELPAISNCLWFRPRLSRTLITKMIDKQHNTKNNRSQLAGNQENAVTLLHFN